MFITQQLKTLVIIKKYLMTAVTDQSYMKCLRWNQEIETY